MSSGSFCGSVIDRPAPERVAASDASARIPLRTEEGGRSERAILVSVLPLLFSILAGCTGLGTAKTYVPESPPEMRAAAASFMGRDINNKAPADPRNPNPRIDLPPTPGTAPISLKRPSEVLRSAPETGAYVAFVGQVPPTKYFEVLGRADCDDWVYVQLMNTDLIINRREYYTSGEYQGDKPLYKCAGIFHRKFRDQNDSRLAGSDGVIFDPESAELADVDGWLNQNVKVRMDGWAIKFVEPTPEMIRDRLSKPIRAPIDVLQMKAAAVWIEKNHASELAPALRRLLPLKNPSEALGGWRHADHFLFRALAAVEEGSEPDDIYRTVMNAGIAPMLRPGSLTTVGFTRASDTPFVAANVMVCRNQPGVKEALRKVALEATIYQHKIAAAKGLLTMGDGPFLRDHLRAGSLGDVSVRVSEMLRGVDAQPYACPYKSPFGA